jgi:hypothetical protein
MMSGEAIGGELKLTGANLDNGFVMAGAPLAQVFRLYPYPKKLRPQALKGLGFLMQ